jgi:flagellar basal body L-ring protein FlgH
MKTLIFALMMAVGTTACAKEEPKKPAEKPAVVENTNCVKKDKKGNCPPAPKGEKPTPKKVEKKAEAKK